MSRGSIVVQAVLAYSLTALLPAPAGAQAVTQALEAERRAARTAGFYDPRLLSAKTIEARFGPPTIRKPEALEYTLLLWPDHVFRWGLDPQGHAFHEGFVLNEMESVQGWLEPGSPSARAALRPWQFAAVRRRYRRRRECSP